MRSLPDEELLLVADRANWEERLAFIVETMREMSRHSDPQAMVRSYLAKMTRLLPAERRISLSRRGLASPRVRVTRFSGWKREVNPWKEGAGLPVLSGGLLSELIYANEPRLIDEIRLGDGDPSATYLDGQGSLIAIPLFDGGESLNMVIIARAKPKAFDRRSFPEWVWMSNLFGRATHTLVLADRLKEAYKAIDHELAVVGEIQRSLLPGRPPKIATMDIATHYQTSKRAGGDYYDFFELPNGKWGILVADVSGHGTPAAVIMAITHGLAHTFPGPPCEPGRLLSYLNDHLVARYTSHLGAFVTAFYGVYDSLERTLTYASAGHNPPRLKRCADGSVATLDCARGLPLGIRPQEEYQDAAHQFEPGDQIVFYTDGITEAMNPAGQMFGMPRLDKALARCKPGAEALIGRVLDAVEAFTEGQPADDDRTMLVAKIS